MPNIFKRLCLQENLLSSCVALEKDELNRYVLLMCLHHYDVYAFNKRHTGGIMSSINLRYSVKCLKNMFNWRWGVSGR